jgi:mono/diheme cytochrome c family protein
MTASTTARSASLVICTCLVLLLAGCGGSGDSSDAEDSQFSGGDATAQRDPATSDADQPATAAAIDGVQVYERNCQSCHGPNGGGRAAFPPLQNTEWVTGDRGRLIRLVLHGVKGKMEVNGRTYNAAMAGMDYLSDAETAAVLTYVRTSFGNQASEVTADQVAAVRQAVQRDRSWRASELKTETGIP